MHYNIILKKKIYKKYLMIERRLNMSEKGRIITIVIVVIALITSIVGIYYIDVKKGIKLIDELKENIEQEKSLIYVGRPTCSYCLLLDPQLKKLKELYGFDYLYLNTDELSSEQFNTSMDLLKITDKEKFGTPYIAVFSKKSKVSEQPGYIDYNKLFDYLKLNGFINETENLSLNYLDFQGYKEMLETKNTTVLALFQTGMQNNLEANLLLEDISKEKNIEINYFNLSTLSTQTEYDEFIETISSLKKDNGEIIQVEDIKMPSVLVIQKDKVIKEISNFKTKEEITKFLIESGVINE